MKNLIPILAIFAVAIACKKGSQLEDDIARINSDIKVERFDLLFSEVTPEGLSDLKTAYPFMFAKTYQDSFWMAKISDTLQQQIFSEVRETFQDFKKTETDIENLFNHIKYYFPEFNPPRVITVTNDVDYRNNIFVTDTISLIALDNYLGADHDFYIYGNIPRYIAKNLEKEQIVVDMASRYAEKYIYQQSQKTLLDEMIYFGKILCFKDNVIPFKTEAQRIGYSQEELDWAMANESYIWRYFVDRELLFSTDSKLPGRFINPAPFTKFYLAEIDGESPGRLGQYMGWQIVRAYMNQNEVSLKDMLITSTEDIFNNTKFKPRK